MGKNKLRITAKELNLPIFCYDWAMVNGNSIELFRGKILGVRNYEADKTEFCLTDFSDNRILLDFLNEVSTGESDITPAGYTFLNQQLDLRKVAEGARKDGVALPPYGRGKTDEERIGYFLEFIRNLQPMETALFIAETSWGSSKDGSKPTLDNIDEKLPPPESTS